MINLLVVVTLNINLIDNLNFSQQTFATGRWRTKTECDKETVLS